MYLWPCKIWYTFHKYYCFNIFLIIFWKMAEVLILCDLQLQE